MTLRLIIADDHEVVRAGLQALLADTSVRIVGEAATGSEAIRLASSEAWDVALIDVALPNGDGFSVLERLKETHPNAPVVLYTAFDNPRFAARAAALGAAGFISKDASGDTLIDALVAAAAGRLGPNRRVSMRFANAHEPVDVRIDVSLTEREQQVLKKLADGLTNKQIAQALEISYETVKEHVQHILQKVGVADRTQAAVWAVRKGLI